MAESMLLLYNRDIRTCSQCSGHVIRFPKGKPFVYSDSTAPRARSLRTMLTIGGQPGMITTLIKQKLIISATSTPLMMVVLYHRDSGSIFPCSWITLSGIYIVKQSCSKLFFDIRMTNFQTVHGDGLIVMQRNHYCSPAILQYLQQI